jgi:hypothetical protein
MIELTPTHAESARRVHIWHAAASLADCLLHGDDLIAYMDDHERLARLTALLGDVASDITLNASCDLDSALLRLHAETALWLEARAREVAQ